jgi:hypothetical protein
VNEAGFTDADILACLRDGERLEGRGYQGSIHTGYVGDQKVLVKSATGTGITVWLNRLMLRREYDIYCRLAGISGIPRCYGFFLGRHLALEFVDARTMRQATIRDRDDADPAPHLLMLHIERAAVLGMEIVTGETTQRT